MKVILQADVEHLGKRGEIVKVADGYARNFLFPKNLALRASAGAVKQIEIQEQKRERERQKRIKELEALAAKLRKTSCTVKARAQEDGQLYGSVGSEQIAAAFGADGIQLAKSAIVLPAPFKALGVYPLDIDLGEGVKTTTTVWIVGE